MKRILIVDDDADLRDLYARYLDDEGYCVAVARDGVEAVEVAEMVHPHAIVMDVSMPRMDGREAAYRIRHSREAATPVIVALTGEDLDSLGESSFDSLLAKPMAAPQLASALADMTDDQPEAGRDSSPSASSTDSMEMGLTR